MDSLRRMIEQMTERFRPLETSQKLAIFLCVVVIVGSLVSLMRWSTAPELVPILAKDFSLDQRDTAEEAPPRRGNPVRTGRGPPL
jgi:flagellar biosynthesis/type III secretory pathway M-ring protein FliF/YscJ